MVAHAFHLSSTHTVSKKIKTKKKESIDGLQFNIPQLFSTLFRLTTQKASGLLMVAPPSTLSPTFGHFELTVLSRSLPLGNSQSLCHPSSKSAHSACSTGLSLSLSPTPIPWHRGSRLMNLQVELTCQRMLSARRRFMAIHLKEILTGWLYHSSLASLSSFSKEIWYAAS